MKKFKLMPECFNPQDFKEGDLVMAFSGGCVSTGEVRGVESDMVYVSEPGSANPGKYHFKQLRKRLDVTPREWWVTLGAMGAIDESLLFGGEPADPRGKDWIKVREVLPE